MTHPDPQSSPRTAHLGEAQIDLDRRRRCGYPEVVYSSGKSQATLEKIFATQLSHGQPVFATRMTADVAEALLKTFSQARYNSVARTFRIDPPGAPTQIPGAGLVAIVTAGTSDLPVAEEVRETALWMGAQVTLVADVGVAGPHRLPEQLDKLTPADAIVVVAGMEGALPSVVAGYVDCPVVAVPTSVGYGANFGGLSALLSMLNSCAANVAVVNIDAGFKAGYLAAMIATRRAKHDR